jgi:hypothetical protein
MQPARPDRDALASFQRPVNVRRFSASRPPKAYIMSTNESAPQYFLNPYLVAEIQKWTESATAMGLNDHDGHPCSAGVLPSSAKEERLPLPCLDEAAPHTALQEDGDRECSGAEVLPIEALCLQMAGLLRRIREEALAMHERQMPSGPPHIHGVECFSQYEHCGRPGGDFFDLRALNPDELMVGVGSVPVEGITGPILISGLLAACRSMGTSGSEPATMARDLNRMVWDMAPQNTTAGLFCARVSFRFRRIDYVNAGHPAAVLIRSTGRAERLEPNAAVLGLSRRSGYVKRTTRFEPGDTLIAVTEGTEDGLLAVLENGAPDRFHDLPSRIIRAAESVARHATDRTVVVVHCNGADGQYISHSPAPFRARAPVAAAPTRQENRNRATALSNSLVEEGRTASASPVGSLSE